MIYAGPFLDVYDQTSIYSLTLIKFPQGVLGFWGFGVFALAFLAFFFQETKVKTCQFPPLRQEKQ